MKALHMKVYPRTGEAEFDQVKQTLTTISNNASTNALVRSDIASILAHADNIVNWSTENDAVELKSFVRHLEKLAAHEHMTPADKTELNKKIAAFKAKYFIKWTNKVRLAISGLVLATLAVGGAMKPGLPEKEQENPNKKTLLASLIEKDTTPGNLEATFDTLWEDIRKDARYFQKLTRSENTLEVTEKNPADMLEIRADEDLDGVVGTKTITFSAQNGTNGDKTIYTLQRRGGIGAVMISQDGSKPQLADEANVGDILGALAGY